MSLFVCISGRSAIYLPSMISHSRRQDRFGRRCLPEQVDPTFDEWMVLMLALMPHLSPQVLDIFFVHNKNFDRPYTEFGGWKGLSHGGFLPTGETAVFLLAGDRVERRLEVVRLFREEHWFHMYHVVGLEGAGNGEPFLSWTTAYIGGFLVPFIF